MAIKFGLWRVDGTQIKQLPPETIKSEKAPRGDHRGAVEILGLGDLFVVGRQVITDFGKLIDLLAIDAQGDLYIIELKKDRTPREVVARALEYGFWVNPERAVSA